MFILLSLLFAVLSASNMNGLSGPRSFHLKHVNAKFDVGFYQFAFGNQNTFAFASFNFCSDAYVSVDLTDGFCIGDAFFVNDQGIPVIEDMLSCGNAGDGSCIAYTEDPAVAITGGWCAASKVLAPGQHNLTINAYYSPYTGGAAWIAFRKYCFYMGSFVPCCTISNNCLFTIYEIV